MRNLIKIINGLVILIIVFMPSLCMAEEYEGVTVFRGIWGRPDPESCGGPRAGPPLTEVERPLLGYIPEEEGPGSDDFQSPAVGPKDFDIDKEGNFYFVDILKRRVVKFDQDGRFVFDFGVSESEPERYRFIRPIHIAVDREGNIYVVDLRGFGHPQKFDAQGNYIKTIDGFDNHSFEWTPEVSSTLNGDICVVGELSEKDNMRKYIFAPNGDFLKVQNDDSSEDGQGRVYQWKELIPEDEESRHVESLDNVGEFIATIEIFSPDKRLIRTISIRYNGQPKGEGDYPCMGVDGEGNLYFYHWYYHNGLREEGLKYDNTGKFITEIKIKEGNMYGMANSGFKVMADGTIYQMHAGNKDEGLSIIKYTLKKEGVESGEKR